MKEMRRWLALFLCFVMLIGVMPVSALAEDTVQETTIATEAAETTAATSEPTETEAPSSEATKPEGTTAPSSEPTGSTEPAVVAVTGITLDVTALEVCVGAEPVTLTATVTPEDATDKTVTWESSDEEVATVDENGTVTFRMLGDAVITATAGEFSASCAVSVILDEEWITGYANEDVIDAAIFCSDVHGSSDDLTSVLGGVAKSGVDYSSIGFVGDTCLTVENTTSIVQSALKDTDIEVMFSYASSHDTEDGADIDENWDYSGEVEGVSENYLVYTIRETDMQNASDASTAAPAFTTWYNGLTAAEKALPIFIMSHRPLHARRNDNAGAATWYSAISAAAETSDIVFFWGHNHTGDNSVDQAAYYVAKDGTESFTVYNGDTEVPNFTYMNAGYINANNQNPARLGIATTVQITADSLVFQDYNSTGEYSGTYAHNVTVDREFAVSEPEVTLSSVSVSGKTEYNVGDELALTVTATYSDGTTADVTAEATLSGYDMSKGGKYTVTAEYEGKTAAIEIIVNPITMTAWDDTDQVSVQATADNLSGITVTNVYGEPDLSATFSDYMSVEVTLEGVADGDEIAYSMLVLDEIPADDLILYHVAEDDTLTPITYTLTTSESGGSYLNFTTTLTGVFAYGLVSVPEGYVLSSIAVANVLKTDYFVGDNLDLTDPIVTATYTKDGAEDFERILYIVDNYAVTDGYTISGYDMTAAGAQTVIITYETCTTSFDINVWGETFADETSGVSVNVSNSEDASDYGVTAANVSESANEYVAEAIADVISGDNYKAYDITLTLAENYTLSDGNKTVTLPIPEGVNNPVVYYVSGDGATVTNMNAVKDGSGNVTFTTTHFSTYVIGESAEITVPDPETATGSGETTTTTKKTVYVLTSSISSGNDYLIANSNSASSTTRYLLARNGSSIAATGITIKSGDVDGDGDNETYIELDDATDELWTVGSGYTFENGSYYLGYTTSGSWYNPTYTFGLSENDADWSYSNNRLSTSVSNNWSSTTYYLRYNSGWTWTNSSSASGRSVYFYVPTEVEVETTTNVSGTYSIAGTPAEVTKVVTSGSTATLGSTLTFTPESGTETTTDTSATATYTVVDGGDPNGIISGISGNTVTFSGKYGKALVKVSYETSFGTVTNYITVTASEPTYILDITDGETVVTGTTLAKKGVTVSTTLQLGTKIQFVDEDGAEIVELPEGATIEWHIPEEYQNIATVGHETGLVAFKGVDGAFYVTATMTVNGKDYTVGVNISATTSSYSVPSDGVTDFPEYPNEGAIRFDKTATAVGNFSETGIAQVELSMTGVPYTTGSEMDVVIMLDQSTSMDDDRIAATVAATKAFIQSIVINEDGSYNGNRIYVGYFNGASTYDISDSDNIGGDLASIDSKTELDALFASIDDEFDGSPKTSGTQYAVALKKCYDRLNTAKTDGVGNDRQQFCVFMSDGVPTTYQYSATQMHGSTSNTDEGYSDMKGMFTGTNYDTRSSSYVYEYYSTQMKANGVTIYTVGLGLEDTNQAWKNASATQCLNAASLLLNDISGPAKETELGTGSNLNKKDSYFFSVEDEDSASQMTNVFQAIAQKILQAATDVTVEDKITDEYTMIFDIPEGSKDITGVTNDFYIEFGKYALDEDHERDGYTSITKLYIENTSGTLSAKDSADPVFEQKTIGDKGTLYYWSTNAADGDAGVSVTVDGTTYYFVSYGMEEAGYNMTSGAYASGTVDTTTNMSEDLVIATPYFVYNAKTRMIYWTVDKLDTEEYVLRYFLYLDNSATEVGTANETDPGSYPTNEHAYITYTNFNGNDCRQEFPIPQLTWSGAQVSYVFYLVNAQGQPINKSGQVVDFANATFVTDVYTEDTVWNKGADGQITADSKLSIDWLAANLLPADYKVYDEKANYKLHVFGDHTGESIFDYFIISGGTAAEISASLNERLPNLNTTASTVSVETTKVYNTKAGRKITGYGTYTSEATNSIAGETVLEGFDFYNTTVAFAVVWQPTLVPDVVVVDYGLDVLINVVQNDLMQNTVSGIGLGKDAYGDIAMNNGVSTTAKLGTAALTTNDGSTISIENENVVRFHQNDMTFEEAAVFYYESPVEFYEGSNKQEGYMYSSVTVIPATTIYYEDEFVDLASYTWDYDNEKWAVSANSVWTQVGTTISATQAQDRPGTSQISADLDADNIYGYDEAYSSCSMYSLGSAMKAHVDYDNYAQAEFSFYGTGFDVISLTSNQTGAIIMEVADKDGNIVRNNTVDTYYGYTQNSDGEWVISENDPNALYQVPVMEIAGLEYGKYTVKIMAVYDVIFDHSQYTTTDAETGEAISAEQYDFYLDAIRIYDPANDGASEEGTVVEEAYEKDKESWPVYEEIRNNVITEAELEGADEVAGIVFIDSADETASVGDYTSYGPNNELYLAPGQAIAFSLNLSGYTMLNESGDTVSSVEAVHVGLKSASSNVPVGYKIFDGGSVATSDDVADVKAESVETATGMYYDITALKDNVIVIYNSGTTGILSLTDVKVTFKQDPGVVENLFYTSAAVIAKLVENMNTPAVTVPTVFTVTTTPTTATAGSRVTVTVTTSADVAAVSVDGTMITTYSVQNGNRIWKFYVSTPDEGSQEIVVNTYNEDGYQSDTKMVTVTVNSVEATIVSAIRSVYDIIKKLFNW